MRWIGFQALVLLVITALVSANEITNVSFDQATDGSKLVTVHYTLTGDTSEIRLDLSLDNGSSYQTIQAGATGAIGPGIAPGRHTIVVDLEAQGLLASPMARFRVAALDPNLIFVPAGSFVMGRIGTAEPLHQVTLTHDFLLGRTEVTNQQYIETIQWAYDQDLLMFDGDYVFQYGVMIFKVNTPQDDFHEIRFNYETSQFYLHAGTYIDPWSGWGPGSAYPSGYDPAVHPVKWVSWFGAACYCDWRSQIEGLPPYYNGQWDQIPSPNDPYTAMGYRLPTEAEWELASRYNDERIHPWGDEPATCARSNMIIDGACVGWTTPVASHPDGVSYLGLHDLAGNVDEFCNDWYDVYTSDIQVNPIGPVSGTQRMQRGGSWYYPFVDSCCTRRQHTLPTSIYAYSGFRISECLP